MTNQDRQRAALPRWRSVVPLAARRCVLPRLTPRRHAELGAAAVPALGCCWPVIARLIRRVGDRHRHFRRVRYCSAASRCGGGFPAGPIQLDIVTPWLASAIEENFGNGHHVEVGGTQIERTENGGTAVRIRDIVVRDADGTVVASAPKAEVRVSGMSLLSGHMRAESLNLVGAEMAVRIEQDGEVTIFAGADKHPIATAAVPVTAAAALLRSAQEKRRERQSSSAAAPRAGVPPGRAHARGQPAASHRARDVFAALLSWIDGIGETGLDGHDLRELGLKNGNLTVDDERTGKHWTFQDINLSVERRAWRRCRGHGRLGQSRRGLGRSPPP